MGWKQQVKLTYPEKYYFDNQTVATEKRLVSIIKLCTNQKKSTVGIVIYRRNAVHPFISAQLFSNNMKKLRPPCPIDLVEIWHAVLLGGC